MKLYCIPIGFNYIGYIVYIMDSYILLTHQIYFKRIINFKIFQIKNITCH